MTRNADGRDIPLNSFLHEEPHGSFSQNCPVPVTAREAVPRSTHCSGPTSDRDVAGPFQEDLCYSTPRQAAAVTPQHLKPILQRIAVEMLKSAGMEQEWAAGMPSGGFEHRRS